MQLALKNWLAKIPRALRRVEAMCNDHVGGKLIALTIINISFLAYVMLVSHDLGKNLLFSSWDTGDYRRAAEIFWGIKFNRLSYEDAFNEGWAQFMQVVPFRGIAVGSYYLALHGLLNILSPTWAADDAVTGRVVCCSLILFQIIAYMVFYICCHRRFGRVVSLLGVSLLVVSFHSWVLTEMMGLGEAFLRPLFTLMMGLLILTQRPGFRFKWSVGFLLLVVPCAQVKSQWAMLSLLMLPFILLAAYQHRARARQMLLLVLAGLASVASVLLVNGLVWHYPTLAGGTGLHLYRKSIDFRNFICYDSQQDKPLHDLCEGPVNIWWGINLAENIPASTYKLLDKKTTEFLLQLPADVIKTVVSELKKSTNYPQEPLDDKLVTRVINCFTWLLLISGMFSRRTRLLAAMGLSLWFIPSLAGVYSLDDIRYHMVMNGMPAALALLIAVTLGQLFTNGMFMTKAVLLLSGGLDSTTTLAMAKAQGFEVYAISFAYGQRHNHELEAAKIIAKKMEVKEHRVFTIDLAGFGGSALTESALAVPKDREESAMATGIPITYVPARNTVFLSFALAWAEVLKAYDIFIGVNALDYSGYPDCRPEFIEAFEAMANLATAYGMEKGKRIRIHTPLIHMTKAEIIQRGMELGVDYGMTTSCYDPAATGQACGHCDACQLRLKGFRESGLSDPAKYSA